MTTLNSWIGFCKMFVFGFLRKLIPECFCNIMLVIMLHFRRPWPRMLNSSSWILWSRRANYCSTYIHQEITFKSANRSTHATKQGNIQMFHECMVPWLNVTQCATAGWQFILILRPFWGHFYIHIPNGCSFLDFNN